MILIFSEHTDPTACEVMEWLDYLNQEYVRINENDTIKVVSFSLTDEISYTFTVNNETFINTRSIKGVWFRRFLPILPTEFEGNKDTYLFKTHLKNETDTLYLSFYEHLQKKFAIGRFNLPNANKLLLLSNAQECGLLVPQTLVTQQKKDVVDFKLKHNRIITKGIQECIDLISAENVLYRNYTEEIDDVFIEKMPHNFFFSSFQELIEKEVELRILYLNRKIFTSAIFSQEIEQTAIDYRKYSSETPNRLVPYKLPKIIESKLTKTMKMSNLNYGAIDMVYAKNKKYYFLEINPAGRFGAHDYECNYYSALEIAKELSKI